MKRKKRNEMKEKRKKKIQSIPVRIPTTPNTIILLSKPPFYKMII